MAMFFSKVTEQDGLLGIGDWNTKVGNIKKENIVGLDNLRKQVNDIFFANAVFK